MNLQLTVLTFFAGVTVPLGVFYLADMHEKRGRKHTLGKIKGGYIKTGTIRKTGIRNGYKEKK